MSARPAWSWPFESPATGGSPATVLPAITPEWALGESTGAGVRVAVIDSGVDASHPALGGSVAAYAAIGEDGAVDTSPHADAFGHGTACAGVIRSVAPGCEILSVQVLGPARRGRGDVLIAGLRWAVEAGAAVCNVSVGTTRKEFRQALHDVADQAYFAGTAIVTAANNVPVPTYPSMYSSVISVAAHGGAEDAYYYNRQPPVEFGARGIDVRVPWLEGAWITATGNSYAAPRIAGLAARIISRHPGITVFELKSILRAIAYPAGDPQ